MQAGLADGDELVEAVQSRADLGPAVTSHRPSGLKRASPTVADCASSIRYSSAPVETSKLRTVIAVAAMILVAAATMQTIAPASGEPARMPAQCPPYC